MVFGRLEGGGPHLPLFRLELVLKLLDTRLQLRYVGAWFLEAFAVGQAALEVFVLERSILKAAFNARRRQLHKKPENAKPPLENKLLVLTDAEAQLRRRKEAKQ